VCRQLAGFAGLSVALQVILGGYQHRPGVAELPGDVGFRHLETVAHGQVVTFGCQGTQRIGHIQLDTHLRVTLQEFRQMRHQLLSGKCHRRGKAHQPANLPHRVTH